MRVFALCLSIVAALFLISCEEDEGGSVNEFNEQEIIELRKAKDEAFSASSTSPLPEDKRASFTGLKYFDPDPDYVVEAAFVASARPDTITMQTSTSEPRQAIRAGEFQFELRGAKHKLAAYTFIGSEGTSFFVPFTDRTTGHDTYYAGRYLDIPKIDADRYVIDFNEAYNPYCAYNDRYSCPLVPRENDLAVAIRAGEKK
ncbi:MAG: DUF1684 domain-containing protein [Candidatus Kapabacteria bacterium]|nr:DUF1684 domain-containing protein [Candidatus Kapabacteria bacterium]